jgi:hypothetical protein
MKTQLLTISAISLLLLGQSAMAFEQINSENGYDAAFQNGWVDSSTKSQSLELFKASYQAKSSIGFEHVNTENGYDAAFRNGWVSPETVAADAMDLVKTSFRSNPETMSNSRFEDATAIDYLSTN